MEKTNTPTGIEIKHRGVEFKCTDEAAQDITSWGIDLPVLIENAIDDLLDRNSAPFSVKLDVVREDDAVVISVTKE